MKLSLPISILLSLLTLGLFPACNSDDQNEVWIELAYNNLSVTSFKLNQDDSVLAHLDTVFSLSTSPMPASSTPIRCLQAPISMR